MLAILLELQSDLMVRFRRRRRGSNSYINDGVRLSVSLINFIQQNIFHDCGYTTPHLFAACVTVIKHLEISTRGEDCKSQPDDGGRQEGF